MAARPPKHIDTSTYSGRFAERLRTLREKAKLTTDQTAEAISKAGFTVATRTYYGWEGGTRQPPLDAFPAIANALGQSIRTLLPPE